jgi:hypothetical protein
MKRVISILSAISLLASCSVATVSSNAATEEEVDAFANDIFSSFRHSYHASGSSCEKILSSNEQIERNIVEGNFEKGDINLDGTVDFYDVAIILQSYAGRLVFGKSTGYEPVVDSYTYYTEQLNWGDDHYNLIDYNGDGEIDAQDAALIYIKLTDFYVNDDDKFTEVKSKDITDNYFSALSKYIENTNYSKKDFFNLDDVTMGDNNLDGKVDSRDAVEILKSFAFSIISGDSSEVEENNIADFNSDTNFDGKVDSSDAVVTLRIYADDLIK